MTTGRISTVSPRSTAGRILERGGSSTPRPGSSSRISSSCGRAASTIQPADYHHPERSALVASTRSSSPYSRSYLWPTPHGPLSICPSGVIWFSLADTGNALWAFQLAVISSVFLLRSSMLFLAAAAGADPCCHLGRRHPAAIACTFRCCRICCGRSDCSLPRVDVATVTRAHRPWPPGWSVLPHVPRYVHGSTRHGCVSGQPCSVRTSRCHPTPLRPFFASLPGTSVPKFGPSTARYGFHLSAGLALLAAAAVVIVQSFR